MAEILFLGTFFEDVWTYKICTLYLLYFQSYETFSEVLSDFHKKFHSFESTRDRELKFCISKYLQKICLETKLQSFLLRNDRDLREPLGVQKSNLGFQFVNNSRFS